MSRWQAPAHVSGITLSTGPVQVVDGFVEVADGLPEGDRAGLHVNGFRPAPADAVQTPADPIAPGSDGQE